MRDKRVPFEKGTCINVGSGEYIIDECINSGGQALLYRCHLNGHENAQRYILKEYYPREAVRENGVIIEGPEWKYLKRHSLEYYYQKAKTSEAYAAAFRQKSHQAQFVSEVIPDDRNMVALMRMASDDCKTIQQKLEEWYSDNPFLPSKHPDLYRVQEGVKIIKGVLDALHMLHGESCGRIVHRDLTPGNILIAESKTGANTEYTIYPIDFSCSAPIGSPFDNEMSVSPGYTHPVLRENSHLLDLYSVAALLLVLVTGMECLHRADNWEVNNLIVENHFYIDDALTTLNIPLGIKSKLESVLKRAVSMHADQYSSAQEMYKELETLEEIIARREMHPEVLYDASATEFKEQCESSDGIFRYEIEPDLVTEAIDCESNQPINFLKKNTILLGGGGAGKTTKIRTLWKTCLDDWYADRENSPIPIFVPLNTFDSGEDGKNFIKDYIAKRYFPNLSKNDSDRRGDLMGMLRSRGKYVLFLDGINEAVGNDKLNAEIAEDFASIESVTVLIASRNDWGDDKTKKLFSTAELLPLDDDLIIKKLQEKKLGSPSQRLLETLRRPMFLAMYLKLKITDKKVKTPGQILREHHKYLIEAFTTGHHCDELECFKLVIQQILPKIASSINSMMFDSEQIYAVVEGIHFKSVEFRDIADSLGRNKLSKNATSILQNCGILRIINKDDEGIESFIFSHQNYLEFYQALDVYNQMTAFKDGRELPESLTAGILPDAVIRFLGELLGEHEFCTKTDRGGESSPVEAWLQDYCTGRKDRAAQLTVRNLIEVMKLSRDRRITANYSNLDLTLVNFYDCNVSNSSFEGATVVDSTFIRFGHRKPVDTISQVHSPEHLVTGCWGEKGILFWDLTTGQVVKRIEHYDTIGTFEISDDEQFVMVRTLGKVTVYRIANREKVNELELYSLNASVLQGNRRELVAFCSDCRTILCSCGPEGEEQVMLWDVYTGKSTPVIDLHKGYLEKPDARTQCCAMSADRSTLYAVSEYGELAVWDLKHYRYRKTFHVDTKVESLIVTPDKKYAALLTGKKVLRVMCISTGAIETVCDSMASDVITATNDYLVWAGDGQLCGYAFEKKEKIAFNTPQITALFADSKGEILFFADAYGRIRIGDLREKRVIVSFVCGTYTDWSKPHYVIPHIYENGIARIMYDSQIQCIQQEKTHVITSRNYCSCFDGNYHICLEANPEGDDRLVVRDLRSGTIVASVSDDLLCIAHNCSDEEIFATRSDFRWAKYYESEQKLVVNYRAGLTKIWDVHTQEWTPAGDWAAEVSHILIYCSEEEWDTMRNELINTSKLCFEIGSYIVCGTHDGHIQFWNLSGSKVADIAAHNNGVEKVYAVPGGTYFVSQGTDKSRYVWNAETFEKACWDMHASLINEENILGAMTVTEAINLGINLRENPFIKPQSADETLIVYYEVAESIVLLACSEKEQILCKRIVSDSGDIVVYFDDPEVFEKPYNSYIRVYNARTQKLLHNYDLFLSKSEARDDNYVEFTNYAVNISLHEGSGKLAAAFADGTVLLFDLLQRTPEACFTWDVIGAENISNCDFTDVDVKQELKRVLLQNGAQF